MPHKSPPEAVLLPLKGMPAFAVGVVFALLRWQFWVRRWIRLDGREEFAKRTVAIFGLHALAGFKSTAIAGLLLRDCDPERRVIVVRMLGRATELPVSEALAYLLRQWMDVRPTSPLPELFVTRTGAIHRSTIMALARAVGATFGVGGLAELLQRFFFDALSRTGDKEAYRYYRAAARGLPCALVAPGRLRAMVDGTDPFRGELRRFIDAAAGREFALAEAPILPLLYDGCIPPEKISHPHPWLPPSHPLVAALSAVEWPADRSAQITLRSAILAEHDTEIDALIRAGSLPVPQVAALLKVRKAAVIRRRIKARRAADPSTVRPPPGLWRGAVPLAPNEVARLDAIGRLKWPTGSKIAKFRATLLKREFPFVAHLIARRKYLVRDAAKLFRLYPQKITEFRGDLAAGVFDHGAPKSVPRAERAHWRRIIRDQFARWPQHLGLCAFWRMLRREFGFPGGLGFVERSLRKPAKKSPASPPVPPAPTAMEAERLESIASVRWPRGAGDADELRRKMLTDHFAFVFDLIDRKALTVRQAAKLFRVPHNLMTEMRSDYRAGTFEHVLAPPPSPAERRKWLDLIYRELPRRPDGETPSEFCRRLRVTYGFPLPFAAVNQILARSRKKDPRGPARKCAKQGFLRVALSLAERARLRAIVRSGWDCADDPASFRRRLLDAHLTFICGLISGWKIRMGEAAEILHISDSTMHHLRKRWLSNGAHTQEAA